MCAQWSHQSSCPKCWQRPRRGMRRELKDFCAGRSNTCATTAPDLTIPSTCRWCTWPKLRHPCSCPTWPQRWVWDEAWKLVLLQNPWSKTVTCLDITMSFFLKSPSLFILPNDNKMYWKLFSLVTLKKHKEFCLGVVGPLIIMNTHFFSLLWFRQWFRD